MPSSGRTGRRLLGLALAATLLFACGRVPAPPRTGASAPVPNPSGLQQLVPQAEQEGKVTIFGPFGTEWREYLTAGFNKAYPRISVDFLGIGGAQAGPRIIAEQQAGLFNVDITVGGTTTINQALLPAGALEPIKDLLVLPEILDPALWWENQQWYSDRDSKYHFLFEGSAGGGTTIDYNTKLVDPKELRSFHDLLDPRWHGKLVGWDPRRAGPSSAGFRFWYHNPQLGPEFIRALYSETGIVVSTDSRQMEDWIAQGRYPLGVSVGGGSVSSGVAQAQGLPIAEIRGAMKEGGALTIGFGGIARLKNAPHPNATKLYVNWLLSRAGQIAFQEIIGENSMRTDIPKEKVAAASRVPEKGVTYLVMEQPKYILDDRAEQDIRRIVEEALAGR